ncbi:MAG TPA: ATP-binding protein [Tepidiformaceae bacterium]
MTSLEYSDDLHGLITGHLSQMSATSEMLSSVEDLSEVLHNLAMRARSVTSADFAAVSTFDDEGKLTRFVYNGIEESQARRLGDPPIGRALLGELGRREKPLRLDEVGGYAGYSGWPEGHPEMGPFLGAPIRAGGRTIGSLYMTRLKGSEPFSDTNELAAAVLALQGAVSVATALARERSGRMSLLEERTRIARDLHDGTIQSLYALGLECDSLARRADFPHDASEALLNGVSRINELIADIRSYITMLEVGTPATQPELSRDLAFVIRQLVPSGIDTVVNITAAALQEISARETEDFLYIAREALSNAVRHGSATKIAIDLRQSPDATAMTIQDNGVGFNQANVRTGLGTVTMRTRAERLAGELTVLGIPGMGTTVRVVIPRRFDD